MNILYYTKLYYMHIFSFSWPKQTERQCKSMLFLCNLVVPHIFTCSQIQPDSTGHCPKKKKNYLLQHSRGPTAAGSACMQTTVVFFQRLCSFFPHLYSSSSRRGLSKQYFHLRHRTVAAKAPCSEIRRIWFLLTDPGEPQTRVPNLSPFSLQTQSSV